MTKLPIILLLLALVACSNRDSIDAEKEAAKIRQFICSQADVDRAAADLKSNHFDAFIDESSKELHAKKSVGDEGVIETLLLVEIQFDQSRHMNTCDVRLAYTGP